MRGEDRAQLGGEGEAQQPPVHRDQRLGMPADRADDLGMTRVEPAGERAERGQDQLGPGRDEAAPRDLAPRAG